jgi:hypothetical protein
MGLERFEVDGFEGGGRGAETDCGDAFKWFALFD